MRNLSMNVKTKTEIHNIVESDIVDIILYLTQKEKILFLKKIALEKTPKLNQ